MARNRVPPAPRRYTVVVRGQAVAEIAIDTGGLIVPGSVAWTKDPAGVSGPDRERAVSDLVRKAGLDPKEDHDRLWEAIWGHAPKRG